MSLIIGSSRSSRTYTLKQFNSSGTILAQGPKRLVKQALIEVYDGVEEE